MIYYCEYCETHSDYKTLGVHVVDDPTMPEEFTFARCEKCSRPVVFLREDYGLGDGFADDEYLRVYPPHKRTVSFALPAIVKESYEEAVRCESHKVYTACVVMIGRTLEAVTKEHVPEAGSMFRGLNKMVESGMLSKEIHEWADVLRLLRNIGAHPTAEKVSRTDASEALDFLQAILETLYYMRPKFVAMKGRRGAPSIATPVNT